MEWNTEIGTKDLLSRIVVLLLALADLAERAAGLPYPTRCRVLWALQQANAVANEFVTDAAGNQSSPAAMTGSEPADAINLAASLRLLALLVHNMAAKIRQSRFQHGHPCDANGHDSRPRFQIGEVIQSLRNAAFSLVECCDTS